MHICTTVHVRTYVYVIINVCIYTCVFVFVKPKDNFTPLYMAAQIGHQEIATLLLAHGADPTIATKVYITYIISLSNIYISLYLYKDCVYVIIYVKFPE